MCVTGQKKYVPLILLTAYRAARLRENMLKDNIKMDSKEIVLMTTRTEFNSMNE